VTRSAVRNPLQIGFGAALIGLCSGCGWHAGCDCASTPRLYPLGAVNQAHYEAMQANGQAAAFTVHEFEFIGTSSELSPAGKDHLLEIAGRVRAVPFPIVIERSDGNSNPTLDEHRRASVAQVMLDLGIGDAAQRTIVAPAYGKEPIGREAEMDAARVRE
jgi:hypothetical protein